MRIFQKLASSLVLILAIRSTTAQRQESLSERNPTEDDEEEYLFSLDPLHDEVLFGGLQEQELAEVIVRRGDCQACKSKPQEPGHLFCADCNSKCKGCMKIGITEKIPVDQDFCNMCLGIIHKQRVSPHQEYEKGYHEHLMETDEDYRKQIEERSWLVFECRQCHVHYHGSEAIDKHLRAHSGGHGDRPLPSTDSQLTWQLMWKCLNCNKLFQTWAWSDLHVVENIGHEVTELYVPKLSKHFFRCPVCKKFLPRPGLNRHIENCSKSTAGTTAKSFAGE